MHQLMLYNFDKTKIFYMEPGTTAPSPPKLSFPSVPLHRPEPSGLATPPPFSVPVAIPFIWEEEPGKPRKKSILGKPNQKSSSVMSLKLPPRMVAEELKIKAGTKNGTSPTSVLDVPYSVTRSRSFSRCYSFNIGSERNQGRKGKNARKDDDILSHKEQSKELNEGSNSPMSLSSCYTSCGCNEKKEYRVKITRFKRHHSFIDVSMHATSHLLIGIYKRLRQIIHWHRVSQNMAYMTRK